MGMIRSLNMAKGNLHISALRLCAVVLFALTLPGCRSVAQITAPVEVVDGRSFYMHTVKKGETAYAISKQYGCDINIVLSSNPGSDNGIREGQVLRIPVEKTTVQVSTPAPTALPNANFIEHEVRRRETLFSIARDYKVDVNDLAAANPGADKGIRPGQLLRIPKTVQETPVKPAENAEKAEKIKENNAPGNGTTHTVNQGETLYAIARQYNVTVEAIQSANPGLSAALKPGQELVIPVRAQPLEPGEQDQAPLETGAIHAPITIAGEAFRDAYAFGLMLPFLAQPTDTIGLTPREKKLQSAALQMYRGALLGFDSLASRGVSAEVFTFDIGDDRQKAKTAMNSGTAMPLDVIIGPAFRDPLHEVASASKTNGTHVICPVPQANRILLASRNMSKAYPSELTVWEGMGKFVARKHRNDHVILVRTKDVDDLKRIHAFRAAYLRQRGDSVAEFALKNGAVSGLGKLLKSTGTNVVVVPSTDRMLLTTLFNELNSINTIVYGTEDWEDFSIIEPQTRNKYHVRFPRAVFIDYNDPMVQDWLEAFRKRYRSEPDEYAFLGYSLVLYYGAGLKEFGRNFPNHFGEWTCKGCLATSFDFVRTGEDSGFENRAFTVVGTENFELVPVKP